VTVLTSRSGELHIGPGHPTVLINDQVRLMDQRPEALAELREGRLDTLLELAERGHRAGVDMADILLTHPEVDEVQWLPRLAAAVHEALGCPISLDSRNPAALEAALKALRPYKALINSVTAERDSLETLLPIAVRYGAAVVGMPIGHRHGLPRTVKGRLEEARVIVETAGRYGIPREDIIIDAICLASSAEPGSMAVTLRTLQALHEELGVATILGIGNAGFGMPHGTSVDLAYLAAAIPWGLDAALVDPTTPQLLPVVRAADFLAGKDPYGLRYIAYYRAYERGATAHEQ